MKKVCIDLENCYGIKKLRADFNFSNCRTYAVYAPNGSMKSSLAQTFRDVSEGADSRDRVFPDRTSVREIVDERGKAVPKDAVFVIAPYDAVLGHTERTSTLLVDSVLRQEYEKLHVEIDKAKELFLDALRKQSGSKRDLEKEVSLTFTATEDQFYRALIRIKDELSAQKTAPFADVRYDGIFEDKVITFLGTKDFKTAIEDYIKKYNELLAASTYFKKGIFTYYNAATIAKSLSDNGFFDAKHTVSLNAAQKREITSQKELEELIKKEKDGISNDRELKKKFAEIEKLIQRNPSVRAFEEYLAEHEEILPHLANLGSFKMEIWKSYIKVHFDLYDGLVSRFQDAEKRKRAIEEAAAAQRTQWEQVIDIFNSRFSVPFTLAAKNRVPVILGEDPMLLLGFTFNDGNDAAPVERESLMQVLSTGEKKALYVLNIIFEVEARKKAGQETVLIVDDIADSFDYKNKYAIIQYLKEIAEESDFKQIILTHNFDFFRTINSRFVDYSNCLMAFKSNTEISLKPASGIKNVFVNDWKPNFFNDPKKRIASVPFIRNLVEYTKGPNAPEFAKLTSLLHWKSDSRAITQDDLDKIYNAMFSATSRSVNLTKPVIDVIYHEAGECLKAEDGANFENKIVLSIAARLAAEQFMVKKIANPKFLSDIESNQTPKLLERFKSQFKDEDVAIAIIQRVVLMTPENIHLNSFMYEPILDMSDEHLRKLYRDVLTLA